MPLRKKAPCREGLGLSVDLVPYHSDPKFQKRGFFAKDLRTFEPLGKTHSIVVEALNSRRRRRKKGRFIIQLKNEFCSSNSCRERIVRI